MKELRQRPLRAPKEVWPRKLPDTQVAAQEFSKHVLQTIYLDIAVDVEPVILAGKHNAAILHERHVEALRMFHLALQSSKQLPSLNLTNKSGFDGRSSPGWRR